MQQRIAAQTHAPFFPEGKEQSSQNPEDKRMILFPAAEAAAAGKGGGFPADADAPADSSSAASDHASAAKRVETPLSHELMTAESSAEETAAPAVDAPPDREQLAGAVDKESSIRKEALLYEQQPHPHRQPTPQQLCFLHDALPNQNVSLQLDRVESWLLRVSVALTDGSSRVPQGPPVELPGGPPTEAAPILLQEKVELPLLSDPLAAARGTILPISLGNRLHLAEAEELLQEGLLLQQIVGVSQQLQQLQHRVRQSRHSCDDSW
ncbi:hypothetical protein cyc_06481 [Cyclospora cayetanensis]|uniref:Uncharacterized protein n=1 Tax=Cyclospora cayetanensis TaxID=88456 RepID=A0A1D3D3H3_9EIME|nr:hypothetical protein cyc_06481 [Cyclospora cayetanensis]